MYDWIDLTVFDLSFWKRNVDRPEQLVDSDLHYIATPRWKHMHGFCSKIYNHNFRGNENNATIDSNFQYRITGCDFITTTYSLPLPQINLLRENLYRWPFLFLSKTLILSFSKFRAILNTKERKNLFCIIQSPAWNIWGYHVNIYIQTLHP